MNLCLITVALLMVATVSTTFAQQALDTMFVTLERKTAAHPYFGVGHDSAFSIDGEEAKQLWLVRGQRYVFQLVNISYVHWFYICNSSIGNGNSLWTGGVENDNATGSERLVFTPPAKSPSILYYQSTEGKYMGGTIHIVDSLPATIWGDSRSDIAQWHGVWPNPAVDRMQFRFALPARASIRLQISDVIGRVLVDRSSAVDACVECAVEVTRAELGPGAYIYRLSVDGLAHVASGTMVFLD